MAAKEYSVVKSSPVCKDFSDIVKCIMEEDDILPPTNVEEAILKIS